MGPDNRNAVACDATAFPVPLGRNPLGNLAVFRYGAAFRHTFSAGKPAVIILAGEKFYVKRKICGGTGVGRVKIVPTVCSG